MGVGRRWVVVGGLLLLGCGPGVQRWVSGDCLVTFWRDDGSRSAAPYCRGLEVTVLGRDLAGGWTEVDRAPLTATGYTVGAPAGPYLLSIHSDAVPAPSAFETSADRVSLGGDVAGRQDGQSTSLSTVVRFQVSGLEAWQPTDLLEVTSSQASTFKELAAPELPVVFGAGDTSGSAAYDWNRPGGLLPVGAAGDVVFLHQATTRPLPGTGQPYRAAARAARLPGAFVVAAGVSQSVPVTLEAVRQTGRFSADWRLSAFEARRAEINPAAAAAAHQLLIDALPHRLVEAPVLRSGGTPDLAWVQLPAGAADQPLVDVPYGQFLPALWKEYRVLRFLAELQASAPGASAPLTLTGGITRCDPLPAEPGPLLPVLTPPRAPRLDGRDAFAVPTGVSLTPAVAWSPPEVGVPDQYEVQVLRLGVGAAGATTAERVGTVATAATSLRLPPGLLQPGTHYALRLLALAGRPGWASAPSGSSCPSAAASLWLTFST